MKVYQSILEDMFKEMPEKVLGQLMERKLKDQGIRLSRRKQRQLLKHILNGNTEEFRLRRWRWWHHKNVAIEFTEKDFEALDRQAEQVFDHIPEIFGETADDISAITLAELLRTWPRERKRQRRERAGFQKRLYRIWGEPLDLLAMLLTISLEWGDNINLALSPEDNPEIQHLADVLIRLHARACQVVDEIIVLLTAGLADGAMARWRTLHEIAVCASFISEHGDELAERYILHQYVEAKRATSSYVACYERLGYEPLESNEIAEVKRSYDEVIARFGKPFGEPNGWAAQQLDKDRPSFADIEKATELDHLRAHYKMSSHNVHADPMGIFFKLGLWEGSEVLLAGASNYGLVDPGHATAVTLIQVSASLLRLRKSLDNLVVLKIMFELEDRIRAAFGAADKKLKDIAD